MNSYRTMSILVVLLLTCWASPALAQDVPRILATLPADGTIGVPCDSGNLVIIFDRPMNTTSYSLVVSDLAPFPDPAGDGRWLNDRTFALKIETMKPDAEYAVGINSEKRKNFKSADGTPLAPLTLGFKTGPTAGGPPFAIRSYPVLGQIDIDPSIGMIKVQFSEALKPGSMTLARLGGTTPLGYLPDKKPYFEQPDILVIPVRLAPGTTYGVSVNTRGKQGFVSAKTGKGVLPLQLVFRTKAGGGPPPPVEEKPSLVGRWMYESRGTRIDLTLGADGRYTYRSAGGGEAEEAKGRWRVVGKEVEVHQDGAEKPARFAFRFAGPNSLAITLGTETATFKRQNGKGSGGESAAKRMVGVWSASGADLAIDLTLSENGRYSYKGRYGAETETAVGRWSVTGSTLVVHEDGAEAPLKVPFRNLTKDGVELQIEGDWIALRRQVR
jgi:hypothetical protein